MGEPAYSGFHSDCKLFSLVGHASHAHTAVDILKAGEIKPSLVFDESKLNMERILVTWLSPNDWWHGYRYGTAKFLFDFQKLIEGKKYYWVEVIAYNTAACRILITDKNRDGLLEPYDPEAGDGPWWVDPSNQRHYFNGNYCLEFMTEDSVRIADLEGFKFVDHHDANCSVH